MKGARHHSRDIEQVFAKAAIAAGRAIMAVLADCLTSTRKADGSPVTNADLRAEEVICAELRGALPGLPIIGEEGGAPAAGAALPQAYILVDPLDGTRDFLGGSPEFTVNIALIENGRAVAGVIHAPALGRLFAGSVGSGAWEMAVGADGAGSGRAPRREMRVRAVPESGPLALESRSHHEKATDTLLAGLDLAGKRAAASSLKFALIAAGEADLYVRGVSLNEWDIAAGDALLTAAGGAVLTLQGEPIRYGAAAAMKAPPFLAIGDPSLRPLVMRRSGDAAASR
ncbi:MAG: 3'(2'),5'-bisphosphate nucleotidase CysQ [Hyphomicrobiales bacterium]